MLGLTTSSPLPAISRPTFGRGSTLSPLFQGRSEHVRSRPGGLARERLIGYRVEPVMCVPVTRQLLPRSVAAAASIACSLRRRVTR